jgi:hypothetical protein
LRKFLLLAGLLLLAGCTDLDWAHIASYDDAPSAFPDKSAEIAATNYAAFVGTQTATASVEQRCARNAQERASDIDNQGFDADLQKEVYDKTYADCLAMVRQTEPR